MAWCIGPRDRAIACAGWAARLGRASGRLQCRLAVGIKARLVGSSNRALSCDRFVYLLVGYSNRLIWRGSVMSRYIVVLSVGNG